MCTTRIHTDALTTQNLADAIRDALDSTLTEAVRAAPVERSDYHVVSPYAGETPDAVQWHDDHTVIIPRGADIDAVAAEYVESITILMEYVEGRA